VTSVQRRAKQRPSQQECNSSQEAQTPTRKWQRPLLVFGVLVILLAVPPWWDVQTHPHWDKVGWLPFVSWPVRLRDVIVNLLLFVPLGAGVAIHAARRPLTVTALVAAAFSVAGELSQVYSHGRFPSATDVCVNIAGAVVAARLTRYIGR